ncbi:MAG TPA: hypothetical protein VK789_19660 [Bryobacteraceae bacterium]|jgi:hypothetical protein|nr:hypothetical protein [Bryobacteraceae bacterium]
MTVRLRRSIIIASTFATCFAFAPTPGASQSAATKSQSASIPRLADGKPDFNGVWDRPRVGDITKNVDECGSASKGCKSEGSGEVSMTAWGLEQFKAKDKFDYAGYCQPWGYTRAWQTEYPVELMQTPERVAILWESNNVFHVVPTDGRDHPKNQDPSWMGNSIGHFEGDTLVIDTNNFNGKTWIDTAQHPSSEQLHVVERVHFIDPNHLAYEVTWEDPKAYTKPIRNNRVFTRMKQGAEIMEWWCMENNRDLLLGHMVNGGHPPK